MAKESWQTELKNWKKRGLIGQAVGHLCIKYFVQVEWGKPILMQLLGRSKNAEKDNI